MRFMELPLYLLLLIILSILGLFNWIAKKKLNKISSQKRLHINAILVLFMLVFVADKKFSNMQAELTGLNKKIRNAQFYEIKQNNGQSFNLIDLKEKFSLVEVR